MASSWGNSWGRSWGNSWGTIEAPKKISGSKRRSRKDEEDYLEYLQYQEYLKRIRDNNNTLVLILSTGL